MKGDIRFMRMAIAQAKKGVGQTHPNPTVGAIVVRKGKVVGTGFHRGPGYPHAEIEAMREAGRNTVGAGLYVTLEPCNTQGRTPPCTKAILSAGIARVYAAVYDPHPNVNGAGIKELREAGVAVETGLLEQEARSVDEAYFSFHTLRRSFVHLKMAQSLDGCVVPPPGTGYLTGEEARRIVHEERFLSDAILVSGRTVKLDNPGLSTRLAGKRKPLLRVLLDSGCLLTGEEKIFADSPDDGDVLVVRPEGTMETFPTGNNVKVVALPIQPGGGYDLAAVLKALRLREIVSLYVEAVGRLAASFLRERFVDKLSVHIAPLLLGAERQPGPIDGNLLENGRALTLEGLKVRSAGKDWIFTANMEGRCFPG